MRPAICVFVFVLALIPSAVVAQYPNVQVNTPDMSDPEEVTIAIDPTNPLNIFASSNIDFVYRSTDGGLTWTGDVIQSSMGVWGDPVVIFDADGNLYYSHLSYAHQIGGNWIDRIVVQKSLDGGLNFDDGIGIGLNAPKQQDKEWMAVDMTGGLYHNNIYLAWTEFDSYGSTSPADSSRILFSRSTDQAVTWSAPVRISELGGTADDEDGTMEGAVPTVGPGGELYMAWAGQNQIWFDKSIDGGVTWGSDTIISDQPGGWVFDIPGIYRCNGFPVTMSDSGSSLHAGNVYVMFSDQRNGTDDTDILFTRSTDGGVNWTDLVNPVAETGAHHQFFPWATIDQSTGYIYIVFYDRRFTVGEFTDVYIAMSTDAGDTWIDFKVSETSFIPESWMFFGDYTNVAASQGKVYPIWMRMDDGVLSVWTALVDIPPSTAVGGGTGPATDRLKLGQNYPNPFNPRTRIEFVLPVAARATLKVYDLGGALVATLLDRPFEPGPHLVEWNGRDEHGQRVSSGVYLYELETGEQSVTRKMTLVK